MRGVGIQLVAEEVKPSEESLHPVVEHHKTLIEPFVRHISCHSLQCRDPRLINYCYQHTGQGYGKCTEL